MSINLTSLPSHECKTGWPWAEEIPSLPPRMPDGSPWPRISIVTPSYNQGQFIEETIRSVLLQCYPNLEYIIIDGGSTDASVEIIKKYEPWLAYWISEPDHGQSHAINKGISKATGDYFAWINSDDIYKPGTLSKVAIAAKNYPSGIVLYSDCEIIDEKSHPIFLQKGEPFNPEELLLVNGDHHAIAQPTSFFLTSAVKQINGVDESLHMIMDIDIFLRLSSHFGAGEFHYFSEVWACFRRQSLQKTFEARPKYQMERLNVIKKIYQQTNNIGLLNDRVIRRKAFAWAYWTYSYGLLKQGYRFKGILNIIKAIWLDPLLLFRPRARKRFKELVILIAPVVWKKQS
jgi:glycosyltransferase involved in cell wall biosynthesis